MIEKSKSSITLKSFFARENCDSGGNGKENGKGKGEGKEEGEEKEVKFFNSNDNNADDVLDFDNIDKKENNLRNQKEEDVEFKDDDNLLLYKMQFCILRVLKSNFLRIKEQQRSGDLVGLIYFPLSFSSSMSTESMNINNNYNNNNNDYNNVDEKNNENNVDVENETRNEGRKTFENCPYSHLTVFQLLSSLLKCIAG